MEGYDPFFWTGVIAMTLTFMILLSIEKYQIGHHLMSNTWMMIMTQLKGG